MRYLFNPSSRPETWLSAGSLLSAVMVLSSSVRFGDSESSLPLSIPPARSNDTVQQSRRSFLSGNLYSLARERSAHSNVPLS